MRQPLSFFLLPFFAIFSFSSFAQNPHPYSAARGANESFKNAYSRFIQAGVPKRGLGLGQNAPAVDLKRPYNQLLQSDIKQIAQWPQASSSIEKVFAQLRDERFLPDPEDQNFLRRPSWLYPDDGCFARASTISERMEVYGGVRPSKVFAFGNLHVKTSNSPLGAVDWWYHVVPAVQSHGVIYVFDPAVDPDHIMTLKQWVALISPNPNSVLISICNSHSYHPHSPCRQPDATEDATALRDQFFFLPYERARLTELGRNTRMELSEYPPWFFTSTY